MLYEFVDLDKERLVALDVLIRKKERVARAYNKRLSKKPLTL